MDVDSVMDDIANRLETIDGLRVHHQPPGTVVPPAVIVSYPESVTFDATYGRGADRMVLPVVAVVGKIVERSTRDALAAYCAGSGSASFKAVLESGTYTAFDDIRVAGIEFDVVTINAVDYMAAVFTTEVIGRGSA